MPRNDPADNGGLFIGRRPGTGPRRWRQPPRRQRSRLDAIVAALLLGIMLALVLSFWTLAPLGALWMGSQLQYWTDSPALGIAGAFAGYCLYLYGSLALLARLDRGWILVRRAAGYDQQQGVLALVFTLSSCLGLVLFSGWLLLFSGAQLAPVGIRF